MRNSFLEHEKNFKIWCQTYDGISEEAKAFLKHIESPNFKPKLWSHQLEAIKRDIYCFEILGKKDLLNNIVTGGGKTTVIAAMIAYLKIVRNAKKFLILVPNTIVRARLVDAFSPSSELSMFSEFNFFFNAHSFWKDRLSVHIMKVGESSAGLRSADIILGNVHQIYEGKDNWRVIQENLDEIVIFNDEAHNTKAENYNDLINKLKPKRYFRLDTTATPDRLDGLHPDSEMVIEYGIKQGMHDKVIKRVVVFHPDIEKVKLTYIDRDTGEVINAEDVPWEEIEQRRIPATKYITNLGPMRQQVAIACQCLEYQRKAVPLDDKGQPTYKPLLFVVAISIEDAKNIAKVLQQEFNLETLLITNESEDEKKEEAMSINRDIRNCRYDAVVSVMMLREGWDVKNISVILLFRKFCYKQIGGQIFSVYGPQVVGRGLRRISHKESEWESCFVVDHPILKHNWLWEMLDAAYYQTSLNPGDLIDEQKIPQPPQIDQKTFETIEQAKEKMLDISKLPKVPEPPEIKEPITEWQEYLDSYKYHVEKIKIEQVISQIKSRNLDSGFDILEKGDLPEIKVQDVETKVKVTIEELKERIAKQIRSIAQDSLQEYDGNADERQELIHYILTDHIKKRFLLGKTIIECNDERLLDLLWSVINQVREIFLRPELIEGILKNPPKIKND